MNISESAQPKWASPVVLADKKDRALQFCVDYRQLNMVSLIESYTLSRMDGVNDLMGNTELYLEPNAEVAIDRLL